MPAVPRLALIFVATVSLSLSTAHETYAADRALDSVPRAVQPRGVVATGLDPKSAALQMTVPEGFHVQVAAAEPDVRQPVQFAIDGRGRLWVAEGHTYPRRRAGKKGVDRILIFEDSDGDGTLDSRKIFVEGLNLVSGIEVGFGGIWVGAAPYLLFIPDANGDDRPDSPPRVLLDGWGYQDTHETLNSFTWGPDGWLYGCQGVFTHSRVGKPGTADEDRVPLNACVWRYHPTRHEFEVFAHGTSNPWGLDFNEHGHAFVTACVIPHLYHVIQGARYQRQSGQHFNAHVYEDIKTIADHLHHGGRLWKSDHNRLADRIGGGHAHCGAMIYLGDGFPASYRGKLFMNNIHGNRVNVDVLERAGSGYVGRHGRDFLQANDKWFRGINLKYGPDGSVWLIDWYDAQACHQRLVEAWDRSNGRIYRIRHGDHEHQKVDLRATSDDDLVRLQLHDNEWHVRTARRVLQERGPKPRVHGALMEILDGHADPVRRLRALWALHVTGGLQTAVVRDLLSRKDVDEHVRSWTVQLACESSTNAARIDGDLVKLAETTSSPLVRLYLASALPRRSPETAFRIAERLVTHAEDAGDHNLPLLIWYGIEPLAGADRTRFLRLASRSRMPKLSRFIVRRCASDVDALDPLFTVLSRTGSDAERRVLLEEITEAFRSHAKLKMPPSWKACYDTLLTSRDATVRDLAHAVAVKFGDARIFGELRDDLRDRDHPIEKRRHALTVLLDGEDPAATSVLLELLGEPALRRQALRGLASYDSPAVSNTILRLYPSFTPAEKADAVNTLASRPASARALLGSVEAGKVARTDLSAFTIRQLSGFRDPELDTLVTKVWGAVRATSKDKLEEIAKHRETAAPGRSSGRGLSNGRALFERVCAACHKLFGRGDTIAPDLTGSNRADLDYLLENIVDPDAVVGKDYQLNILVTRSGRVVSGLIVKRTSTALTVRTTNGEVVVPLDNVVDTRRESTSMMPQGLLSKLSPAEIHDLLAYLRNPVQVPMAGEPVGIDKGTRRVPGAIEGELMKILRRSRGNARPQVMREFRGGRWSGDSQLWWTGAKPGDTLELGLSVAKPGRYQIDVALTRAVDYGVLQFRLDGKDLDEPIDLFNPRVVTTGPLRLGMLQLDAGQHRLEVEVVGANPQAEKGFMLGLDYVRLIPKD